MIQNKIQIALDSNFLLIPGQFKVDIFERLNELFPHHELVVPILCIEELKKISKTKSKAGRAAALALEIVSKKKIKFLQSKERNADRALLSWATSKEKGVEKIVATVDKQLIKSLKAQKIRIIRLRQKRLIVME